MWHCTIQNFEMITSTHTFAHYLKNIGYLFIHLLTIDTNICTKLDFLYNP